MSTLAARLAAPGLAGARDLLRDSRGALTLADVESPPADMAGATVALCLASPRAFVSDLIARDGHAAGLLLLAPGLPSETVTALMRQAGATAMVTDRPELAGLHRADSEAAAGGVPTAWLMTTSGTTGTPKIVRHTLASLSRSSRAPRPGMPPPLWGLLYDPSRFAGLQVVLQSLLGGGILLAPDPETPLAERLAWLAGQGCTHLSATPTLWRKLLMLPEADALPLRQITLGGEIADAGILRALAARYPAARITHIYASTEVGAGFSVTDGLPGFPASLLDTGSGDVAFRIVDDVLWLRPREGRAGRGDAGHIVTDIDGFVCTGDRVRREGDRLVFAGRDGGAVNIGGTKVQPEDVEAIVNGHPDVAACLVSATPNPIMGALLTLAVVPRAPGGDPKTLRDGLRAWCRERLPREAQPASIRIVDEIAAGGSGKIARMAVP